MNKVILAGLALVLVRDCDIGGPRFHGPIKGTWGGEYAGMIACDTTAHGHIGGTAGDTKQALVADEQGRFDAPGRYNITLYPVARGPDHPARFTGSTDGHVMTLTVTLTDTAVTPGPVGRELGEKAEMGALPFLPEPPGNRGRWIPPRELSVPALALAVRVPSTAPPLVPATSPGNRCVPTAALTQPVDVIRPPQGLEPMAFQRQAVVRDCS